MMQTRRTIKLKRTRMKKNPSTWWKSEKTKLQARDIAKKNHPEPGRILKVNPIVSNDDIQKIKDILIKRKSIKHYAIFVLGINTNLRASDLLRLRVSHVRDVMPMENITIREKKTGKLRDVYLNKQCYETVKLLLDELKEKNICDGDRYLFYSPAYMLEHMGVKWVNKLVQIWCKQIGLKGRYGSHTLRKTWGYHQRVDFGVDIPTLMTCFNHDSQEETLNYLCIQPEEIKNVFENEI